MTNEEAIELLRTIEVCSFKDKSKKYFPKDVVEALDMAIECLQSSEMWNGTTTDKRIFAPKGTFQKVFEDGKAEPCEDLEREYEKSKALFHKVVAEDDCISRTALLSRIDAERKHLLDLKMDGAEHIIVHHARRIIEDMPSATPYQTRWIPIKTRPLTEKEKEEYADLGYSEDSISSMYDCPLPEDGEEVLITTRYDDVRTDTFYRDEGCYFETYCDEDDVKAWMPLPQPYKGESEDENEL